MNQPFPPSSQQRDVYTVSRLTTEVRFSLEQGFPLLWVQGEIGNLSTPASGHIYFTLKDAVAQVRCALFRGKRTRMRYQPKQGDQVLVRTRISLYEARGDFQLIVEHMEPAGEGALRQALEALKQKLSAEGLFAQERKQPLPAMPKRIGVVTSPSGAAVQDVLTVLKRRFPAVEVIIYPIPVQGDQAAAEIVEMLHLAQRRNECDLLILTRGGGSLEDLMAFNDEHLVRTIAQLKLPIISAVGHEIDTTLADMVADHRTPTPSAAAELATPDRDELQRQVANLKQRLSYRFREQLSRCRQRLDSYNKRLQISHPKRQLEQRQQQLDELQGRLLRSIQLQLDINNNRFINLQSRLKAQHPALHLAQLQQQLTKLTPRLRQAIKAIVNDKRRSLSAVGKQLHTVSPLATLERGYAIAWKMPEKEIVREADQVSKGDQLEVRLGKGTIKTKVID